MTAEPRRGLGPLGTRLLVAFVIVALSSVVVLVVAALVGTSRGLAAGQDERRQAGASAAASAAALAYTTAGGWAGADLAAADAAAAAAGARLLVRDATGAVVSAPDGMGAGMGLGLGPGGMNRADVVVAPVVVDGVTVGTVYLGFGTGSVAAEQQVAWTWILLAAVAALATAVAVAWLVTRRLSRPLVRLAAVARAFAAGDRAARADEEDLAAPGELGELARAFDLAAEDVERSETSRGRMAADLAHELRTPLTALQAGLEELRDGYVAADPERLAALHTQSERLSRIVDDLAALSAAETAALSLHRAPLDLGDLVAEAVVAAAASTSAAGLEVRQALDRGVVVDGDEDRLHQVVGNLLANAARYCRAGDTVTVTVTTADGGAVLRVADSGPGIPAEDLTYVFDRLWRGRADTEGSGIGLAVVRELVEAHGGRVGVESDGRSGSAFTVSLPLSVGARAPGG
jgi:two-component system, OmpR family, sensor histidine kinase BaeS